MRGARRGGAVRPGDPELTAALAAVAEGPGDDGAKRVLADLLLERGDARGEFLLLQFLIAENQGSGPLRKRADDLFRLHKKAWMAGAEKVLTNVRLERGFPVEAELRGVVRPHLDEALRSPMMATLRVLSSCLAYAVPVDGAIVDVACSPRMRNLREVTLRDADELRRLCAWPQALPLEALTVSRRGALEPADCVAFAAAPSLSLVARLVFPTPFDPARDQRSPRPPERLGPLAPLLEPLAKHPRLESVIVSGELAGEPRRISELVGLWGQLPFKHLQLSGTAELRREGEGTCVSLQNLSTAQLLDLRSHLPRDTVRVQLAPRFDNRLDDKKRLSEAFAGFPLTIL